MSRLFLGVDTSNYTTSVSCVSDEGIVFERRTVLSVPLGERGLRQSDAVFQHVRNLPPLIEAAFQAADRQAMTACAVSVKPTGGAESYMPAFLAGKLAAASAAAALGIPLYETTHQAGHLRAALFGQEGRFGSEKFLAMHVSGGTTDLLLAQYAGGRFGEIERIGGCDDLHAGQFVDRTGVRLGLPFPSGARLERMAGDAMDRSLKLPSSVRGLRCSFSGQETQCKRWLEAGVPGESVAFAVYDCLSRTIAKLLTNAFLETGCDIALLMGGVSGSPLLRELLRERLDRALYYAPEGLSSDNAVGVALIARDLWNAGR